MSNLTRITITIPEDLFRQVKMTAGYKQQSTSAYISETLRQHLGYFKKYRKNKNPLDTLGVLKGGKAIVNVDNAINELYEQHLKRKIGY